MGIGMLFAAILTLFHLLICGKGSRSKSSVKPASAAVPEEVRSSATSFKVEAGPGSPDSAGAADR
eukprot:2397647-Prymnesium_polylepis.1